MENSATDIARASLEVQSRVSDSGFSRIGNDPTSHVIFLVLGFLFIVMCCACMYHDQKK